MTEASTTPTRGLEGVQDLLGVLEELGLPAVGAEPKGVESEFDAILEVGGSRLTVDVKRDVRDSDVLHLIERLPDPSIVVADRLSPRAREALDHHHIGWFDRRGHIRLVIPPGIFIDREIDPRRAAARNRTANPFTTVGLDVAIALLSDPGASLGVREISRRTGASVGRVSELIREFRRRGLVNRDGSPAIPDLFDAVSDAWDPAWIDLGGTPPPDPSLHLGGTLAALWYRVPLVVTAGWPPEIYVRDEFALRRLLRTYPPDQNQTIFVAKAAVCPSTYGFDQARDSDLEFPVVNQVIVALDLAQDLGRGREALSQWNPEGVVRVW